MMTMTRKYGCDLVLIILIKSLFLNWLSSRCLAPTLSGVRASLTSTSYSFLLFFHQNSSLMQILMLSCRCSEHSLRVCHTDNRLYVPFSHPRMRILLLGILFVVLSGVSCQPCMFATSLLALLHSANFGHACVSSHRWIAG